MKKLIFLAIIPFILEAQAVSSRMARHDSLMSMTPSSVITANDSVNITGRIKGSNTLWLDGTT